MSKIRNNGKMLQINFVSAQAASILQKLIKNNVTLYNIADVDLLTVNVWVAARDYKKLKEVLDASSTPYTIVGRQGFLWRLQMLFHHPIFALGLFLIMIMSVWISERVLFVKVTGNVQIPERYILECADDCGIRFGADRSMVRSEKVKNELLFRIPQLQWIGINTYGCVAEISVKEGTAQPQVLDNKNTVSVIVASCDGMVESVSALQGTALCAVGQSVKEGDVLISGYTDCGLKIQAQIAKGEVFAFTNHKLTSVALKPAVRKGEYIDKDIAISLRVGKKLIKLWNDSVISDTTCDKMYMEDYWTMPGAFRLPVATVKEITVYRSQDAEDCGEYPVWLNDLAEDYLQNVMVAGRILTKEIVQGTDEWCWTMTGEYACHEMIGKVKYEEILPENAEDN